MSRLTSRRSALIASAREAIQGHKEALDCFVAMTIKMYHRSCPARNFFNRGFNQHE
jgi:hypothetical protein